MADGAAARDGERLLGLYRGVVQAREFELATSNLYRDAEIPGFVHVSLGQEASAVGACAALRRTDLITSNHRGHSHCLAKGVPPLAMFAELFAREAGACGGRGGSMHIADPDLGILGANGIVAAGLPIAVGAGLACRIRGDQDVVVAFFGDGAVSQGMFHEAVNLAALWRLPVAFFCENNGYAEFTPADKGQPVSLGQRAAGYGLPHIELDGTDVWQVHQAMEQVVGDLREGGGPVIVEAHTVRWHGHYEGDPQKYRDRDELELSRGRDGVAIAAQQLRDLGVSQEQIDEVHAEARALIARAVDEAKAAPPPAASTAGEFVYAPRPHVEEGPVPEGGEAFKYVEGIRAALRAEMEADADVVLAGIDVGAGGGAFAVTRGLHADFPDRVLDTPISETAILGTAVGGAMAGLRPVVELQYMDFMGVCFDQLLNQAAKLHFMSGGKARLGLTVRTQFGAGRSAAAQHSQSLEALVAHIPGLTVVMPATPADAYGLLRTAIHDPNPVLFVENRMLYGTRGPRPPEEHRVPIGEARLARPGSHITVVSYSRMLLECVTVADQLADEGIDAEVIDLRTICPLDRDAILSSVQRTGRLVVVHEAVTDFGVGAEIAATVARDGFWYLDAPIERVGAEFSPAPYAPELEAAWLPGPDDIADAIRRTVRA